MTINTACGKCGGTTRLVGIEPHAQLAGIDVWTLECGACGHLDAVVRPVVSAPALGRETAAGQTLN